MDELWFCVVEFNKYWIGYFVEPITINPVKVQTKHVLTLRCSSFITCLAELMDEIRRMTPDKAHIHLLTGLKEENLV